MMKEFEKQSLKVVDSGGLKVSLEYITIGNGEPKTLILSGIHGCERSGNLIIAKFLADLPEFTGTLTILPLVNPLGYALGAREEPISSYDLNRQFTGKNDGSPAFLITNSVMELAKKYDVVIDLHNYTTTGLIQVAFSKHPKSAAIAGSLNAEIVRAPHIEQAYKVGGRLGSFLKDEDIPYVLLELPYHSSLTEEHCQRVVAGLKSCLKDSNAQNNLDNLMRLLFVRIKLIRASEAGVFTRNKDFILGDQIQKGDVLGTIIRLPQNEEAKLLSPYEGIICEMHHRTEFPFISGETLFGIGEVLNSEEKNAILEDRERIM